MFIFKSNSRHAVAVAGYSDIKLLNSVGVDGIKKLSNARTILTRLVEGNFLVEGSY